MCWLNFGGSNLRYLGILGTYPIISTIDFVHGDTICGITEPTSKRIVH